MIIPMKSVPSTIDALKRMVANTTDESIKKALLNAIEVMEEKEANKNKRELFVSSINGVFNKKDFREWFLSEEIFTKEKEYRYPDKAFDKI